MPRLSRGSVGRVEEKKEEGKEGRRNIRRKWNGRMEGRKEALASAGSVGWMRRRAAPGCPPARRSCPCACSIPPRARIMPWLAAGLADHQVSSAGCTEPLASVRVQAPRYASASAACRRWPPEAAGGLRSQARRCRAGCAGSQAHDLAAAAGRLRLLAFPAAALQCASDAKHNYAPAQEMRSSRYGMTQRLPAVGFAKGWPCTGGMAGGHRKSAWLVAKTSGWRTAVSQAEQAPH